MVKKVLLWQKRFKNCHGCNVPGLILALESFPISWFFNCTEFLAVFSFFFFFFLKTVEVSTEWALLMEQSPKSMWDVLRKRLSIHILSSLWVAPENNDAIAYTEAKGKKGEKSWPNGNHHCKQLRRMRVMQTQFHKMEITLLKASGMWYFGTIRNFIKT